VRVDAKPNCDKEDYKDEFEENDKEADGSVEVFEPPYRKECLDSNGLRARSIMSQLKDRETYQRG
jgi:hypothetical protein